MASIVAVWQRALILAIAVFFNTSQLQAEDQQQSFFDLSAITTLGVPTKFDSYRGFVLLVTNIATRCGTTPQLNDLETLHKLYAGRKFAVLGFPSGDFSPSQFQNDLQVQEFCASKYGITFPVFQSGAVSGSGAQSVFKFLTEQCTSELRAPVGYNFEKFLVGRDGQVKQRYGSFTGALSSRVIEDIERELKK